MKKEVFNTLPLNSRKELIDLRNYLKEILEENAEVIQDVPAEDVLCQFKDLTDQFAFVVRFEQFDEKTRSNIYSVYYSPVSPIRLQGIRIANSFSQIKESFNKWINLVNEMHKVTEEYYDPFKNFYDKEFADFFSNNDEDAAINPFELNKQEMLYYFLTFTEKRISTATDVSEKDKTELLNNVAELKVDIPKLTKKRFTAALSKFAQKTKKISNQLFHDIFDVLKKEMIKKLLYEGADQIHNISHWIHSLN